ncbi:MAG TPA: hypothetical protein VIL46_08495 [Gemmataceae bacterium]
MFRTDLVITLDENSDHAAMVEFALRSAGPFAVGERRGSRLGVALEAEDERAAGEWREWTRRLPGVIRVGVARTCPGEKGRESAHAG